MKKINYCKKLSVNSLQAFIIYLFLLQTVQAQAPITLTFSVRDAASGNIVLLQSVMVSNLTQDGDTTVYGDAPTLVLQETYGIFELNKGQNASFSLEPNFPNPFGGTTNVTVLLQSREQLSILLYDQQGAIATSLEQEFSRGAHHFEVAVPQNKLYLLSVSDGTASQTLKLFSSAGNTCRIAYTGADENTILKTETETTTFTFQPGDMLEYTVNASGYYEYATFDNPTEDTDYVFDLQANTTELQPTVTTATVTNITATSATCGGSVSDQGSAVVTVRGVCWGTVPNPTTANNFTSNGNGTGTFTSTITGLSESTTYFVRAFAINQFGTAYGNEVSFNTTTNEFFITTYVDYRQVLLEEFTGHLCVNCPAASMLAQDISEELDHKLIVYGIHTGNFAEPIPGTLLDADYRSPVGDALFNDFMIFANPLALIDRIEYNGFRQIFVGDWESVVENELQLPNIVNMRVSNTYFQDTNIVTVKIESEFMQQIGGQFKLAVYIVEDSIISPQLNNDSSIGGDTLFNYVHRNVLRDAISPIYGDFLGDNGNITVGQVYENEYTYPLNSNWVIDHCRIIAFIGRWDSSNNFVDIVQSIELDIKN